MDQARLARVDWGVKKSIMASIIDAGGVVFGGACRDWYRHDHFEQKYFELGGTRDRYGDASYLPETAGRLAIPSDIDAMVHISKVEDFMKAVERKRYTMKLVFDHDPARYIPNWNMDIEVRHRRYKIEYMPTIGIERLLRKHLSLPAADLYGPNLTAAVALLEGAFGEAKPEPILLDLFVSIGDVHRQPEPPFATPDFMCNGLLADATGFRLSKYAKAVLPPFKENNPMSIQVVFQKTLDDIVAKVARPCHPFRYAGDGVPPHRINKMLDKGWTINGFCEVEYIKDPIPEEDAPMCLICHSNLPESHYKMSCCQARFHLKCLIRGFQQGTAAMQDTHRCLMCRSHACGHDLNDLSNIADWADLKASFTAS